MKIIVILAKDEKADYDLLMKANLVLAEENNNCKIIKNSLGESNIIMNKDEDLRQLFINYLNSEYGKSNE